MLHDRKILEYTYTLVSLFLIIFAGEIYVILNYEIQNDIGPIEMKHEDKIRTIVIHSKKVSKTKHEFFIKCFSVKKGDNKLENILIHMVNEQQKCCSY